MRYLIAQIIGYSFLGMYCMNSISSFITTLIAVALIAYSNSGYVEDERNYCIGIIQNHIDECNRLAEKFSADEFTSEGYKVEAASLELVKKEIG